MVSDPENTATVMSPVSAVEFRPPLCVCGQKLFGVGVRRRLRLPLHAPRSSPHSVILRL